MIKSFRKVRYPVVSTTGEGWRKATDIELEFYHIGGKAYYMSAVPVCITENGMIAVCASEFKRLKLWDSSRTSKAKTEACRDNFERNGYNWARRELINYEF